MRNDYHNLSNAAFQNKGKLALVRYESNPEIRNPRTGLPEQAYYRPPTPKNIQAAKNGLAIMLLGFLVALPFWFGVAQEWRQILSSIERTVGK